MPEWDNFEKKYLKHPAGEDKECWCDLLKASPIRDPSGAITRGQYDAASKEAIEDSWLEYEAEESDREYGGRHPRSVYFIDEKEIKVIVREDRIINCLHMHYGGRGHEFGRYQKVPLLTRQHEYITWLREEDDGGAGVDVKHDSSGFWPTRRKREKR